MDGLTFKMNPKVCPIDTVYAAAYVLGHLLFNVGGIIGFVLPPAVNKLYDEGRLSEVQKHLSYSLKYLMVIAIPFVVGSAVLCEQVLRIVATAEYSSEGRHVIPVVALAFLVWLWVRSPKARHPAPWGRVSFRLFRVESRRISLCDEPVPLSGP